MRLVLGFVAGYGISVVTSILWFHLSGHDPHGRASLGFIILTAIYGLVFAALGGFVAARIGGGRAAYAVAGMILLAALASSIADRQGSHWSQIVAAVFMAPAAVAGGRPGKR